MTRRVAWVGVRKTRDGDELLTFTFLVVATQVLPATALSALLYGIYPRETWGEQMSLADDSQ